MTKKNRRFSRRSLIFATGALGASFILRSLPTAAQNSIDCAADDMSGTESLRQSMGYIEKSNDLKKTCTQCTYFSDENGESCGSCQIFSGGSVNPAGFCNVWSA